MSELDDVKGRIEAALKRIKKAVEAGGDSGLKAELKTLKAKRKNDLAELDELLRQLKPMMEEGADA